MPGAAIVGNREIALRAGNGAEDDAAAIAAFRRAEDAVRPRLATIYLPGADIDGGPLSRPARQFVAEQIANARTGGGAVWLVADAGRSGSAGGWALVDSDAERSVPSVRPEDVAATVIARLGIPAARDLAGSPRAGIFRAGALEGGTVATFGERRLAAAERPTETGREYLEKLKSLGYLQ
jgi:hypothetical protein